MATNYIPENPPAGRPTVPGGTRGNAPLPPAQNLVAQRKQASMTANPYPNLDQGGQVLPGGPPGGGQFTSVPAPGPVFSDMTTGPGGSPGQFTGVPAPTAPGLYGPGGPQPIGMPSGSSTGQELNPGRGNQGTMRSAPQPVSRPGMFFPQQQGMFAEQMREAQQQQMQDPRLAARIQALRNMLLRYR